MKPGEYFLEKSDIDINAGRETLTLIVSNTGDRPVQVGSHFHFYEVNRALKFDRAKTLGMRLNIPSGTAVRFEPGQDHEITLVPIAGNRIVYGFNSLLDGSVSADKTKSQAADKLTKFLEQ